MELRGRRSLLQCLDLIESSIPDARTIWLFRDSLAQAGAGTLVYEQVQQPLQQHGYVARCGQIVDASLLQAPVQRNKREEADTVGEGMMPLSWEPHMPPWLAPRYLSPASITARPAAMSLLIAATPPRPCI